MENQPRVQRFFDLWSSRVGELFDFTTDEFDDLCRAVSVYYPDSTADEHLMLQSYYINSIIRCVSSYGTDGYGDKPSDMGVCLYWISHIDERAVEDVLETINAKPPQATVCLQTKGGKAAPKCAACKTPLSKGDLFVKEVRVRPHFYFELKPWWSARPFRSTCGACSAGKFPAPVVDEKVPKEMEADAHELRNRSMKP